MIRKTFQRIAVIGRARDALIDTLIDVTNYLLSKQLSVVIEKQTAAMMSNHSLPTFADTQIPGDIDLMIVVGGDGSLLNAAHCALLHQLPVLGINRGRLGFLTDIHPDEITKIGDVLSGCYITEERFLLNATLHEQSLGIALNDVVLLPGDAAHLIEFDIMIDGQFVCQQRADGLIVSTPTGSTAYALSGGGPILHPQLNAIALVPMFPHTLSSRPIVVNGNATIELLISEHNETSPYISCDGQKRHKIAKCDRIIIKKLPQLLQLIHPNNYDYFTTLREKLGWESRQGCNK